MSFLLAGPSITELARKKVVIDLFRMKRLVGVGRSGDPRYAGISHMTRRQKQYSPLGGRLEDVFKTTKPATLEIKKRFLVAVQPLEALVCYYLNLCLIGSNAVVFKNSQIPSRILDA